MATFGIRHYDMLCTQSQRILWLKIVCRWVGFSLVLAKKHPVSSPRQWHEQVITRSKQTCFSDVSFACTSWLSNFALLTDNTKKIFMPHCYLHLLLMTRSSNMYVFRAYSFKFHSFDLSRPADDSAFCFVLFRHSRQNVATQWTSASPMPPMGFPRLWYPQPKRLHKKHRAAMDGYYGIMDKCSTSNTQRFCMTAIAGSCTRCSPDRWHRCQDPWRWSSRPELPHVCFQAQRR